MQFIEIEKLEVGDKIAGGQVTRLHWSKSRKTVRVVYRRTGDGSLGCFPQRAGTRIALFP